MDSVKLLFVTKPSECCDEVSSADSAFPTGQVLCLQLGRFPQCELSSSQQPAHLPADWPHHAYQRAFRALISFPLWLLDSSLMVEGMEGKQGTSVS